MPKQQDGRLREGYLLLADISGYTQFLTTTELDHAQAIIRELTTLIRERLSPPMRFVKLEGDAVFCYADAATFRDAERILELIEACYFDYSNHLDDMIRETTCRCAACAAIGSLGLKFVAHYGTFIVERDGAQEDLAGPDVILAHRLLKNTVTETGGSQAYAFLTDTCLAHIPQSVVLPKHNETYESFGELTGGVHDLEPVLAQMREARHHYIAAEEADFEFNADVAVPPSVAWKYFVDPIERQRWACRQFGRDPDELEMNAAGRSGLDSTTHCGHGPGPYVASRRVTDWRPFTYFTCRTMTPVGRSWVGRGPVIETVEFTPAGMHGARVVWRWRIVHRGRMALMVFAATKPLFRAYFRRWSATLQEIAREDAAAVGLDEIPTAR